MSGSLQFVAGAAALATAVWFPIQARADERTAHPAPPSAAASSAALTMQRLARPITVELTDARLEDVLQFAQDFSGADLDIFWSDESRSDGLNKDAQVSLNVRGVTVLEFIERALDASADPLAPATWQLTSAGAVEIGPKSRLNESATVRLYDINDLLFRIPDFDNAPQLDLDQVLNQGQQGGGGGGGGIFEDEGNGAGQTLTTDQLAQQIIDIIITSVEPEQWQDNGGSGATIRFYDGHLLIRAPSYIHRQLDGSDLPRTPRAAHSVRPVPSQAEAPSLTDAPTTGAGSPRPAQSEGDKPPVRTTP